MDEIATTEPIIALEEPPPFSVEVPVLKVFDGDGFLTRIRRSEFTHNPFDRSEEEVTIRLGFVDAPELEQPGGHGARDFLASLIKDRKVRVVVLTKMDTGRSTDRYGRVVAVPYLQEDYCGCTLRTTSGVRHRAQTFGQPLPVWRNIELEMVLNGWAWVLDRYGPDERYFEALEFAQRTKRGIWASDDNIHPWTFKSGKARKKPLQPSLFDAAVAEPCPNVDCDGKLMKRRGRFGDFMGCSNYPSCSFTRSSLAEPDTR